MDDEFEQKLWLTEHARKTFGGWLGITGMVPTMRTLTFENFEREQQPKAYDAAQMYARILEGTLILCGSYGLGKTHLMAAICNRLLDRRKSCLFCSVSDLFTEISHRMAFNRDYTNVLKEAGSANFLVLDDIGKYKPSEFRLEIYFTILDERARRGLPTALTSNRLDDLDTYIGGACASRLLGGALSYTLTGDDYRFLKGGR